MWRERRRPRPQKLHTGAGVLTAPEFLRRRDAFETHEERGNAGINAAMQEMFGERLAAEFRPSPLGETRPVPLPSPTERRATEIDLPAPKPEALAKLVATIERSDDGPISDGEDS
jgi:hypothetical protein